MTENFAPPLPPMPWEIPLPAAMVSEGVRVIRAVPYSVVPGFRPLLLDAFLPDVANAPCVLFIHGGGFFIGDREDMGPAFRSWRPGPFERLAQAGVAVLSIDYRLTGEAIFPAQVHDCAAALRYINARAVDFGIDPSRIVVWGESAGANLAMLLAFLQDDGETLGTSGPPVTSAPIAGLINWYGLADVRNLPPKPPMVPPFEALLLGGDPAVLTDAARDASPVSHVRPGLPPILIAHGEADRLIPITQSQELERLLVAAGNQVETIWYPGADHAWLGEQADIAELAFIAALEFVQRVASGPRATR